MLRVKLSVFVFVRLIPPSGNLPNSILTPRVASWRNTQAIAVMEAVIESQILPELKNLSDFKKNIANVYISLSTCSVRLVTFHCQTIPVVCVCVCGSLIPCRRHWGVK